MTLSDHIELPDFKIITDLTADQLEALLISHADWHIVTILKVAGDSVLNSRFMLVLKQ